MRLILKKIRTDDSMFDEREAENVAIIAELLGEMTIEPDQPYYRQVTFDIVMKHCIDAPGTMKIKRMSITEQCDHEPMYKQFIRRLFKIK